MSKARRPLIAGNWKMNGFGKDGMDLARRIAGHMKGGGGHPFDMLICPPFTMLSRVGEAIAGSGVTLGAQDCHPNPAGAYTGDISAAMLADAGCSYVIVGHSERRARHGETDAVVKTKAEAAWTAGLTPIICIGETEAERDAGQTLKVIKTRLAGSVPDGATAARAVIAYEPVWAIGSGRTPAADEVQEVHACIRGWLAANCGPTETQGMRLLYGGSMNAKNAEELLALPDVDGGLIGGAALKAESFLAIGESCR